MAHNPWLKFYPSDWRSDPRLRMCSLAARGLWMEMISLMHEAEPYGHLLVSGIAPTDAQLTVLTGAPPEQLSGLLGELELAGVFSRTPKGVIYSRRMTRDEKKARVARKNGKNGGNPKLGKQREFSASDNRKDKPPDKAQKPEARSQKKNIYSEPFESFWRDFPHPDNPGSKLKASKHFERLMAEDLEQVRLGVIALKQYANKNKDWYHTPMAETWLNQRRWETQAAKSEPASQHAEMLSRYGRGAA